MQGVWWHLLNFVIFSSHLVDDTQHHGHSCALLGVFLKINFRYSSDGCSDSENLGNTPARSVEPAQASSWCARLSGMCPVGLFCRRAACPEFVPAARRKNVQWRRP